MSIKFKKMNKDNIDSIKDLNAGEWIEFTGDIITLRDSSALRLNDLPIDLKGTIVLYGAPTEGERIIIGPTTSKRMDSSLEDLLKKGVIATIGKGNRGEGALALIKEHKAPYFVMMSGVSSYLSSFFKEGKIVAFQDLGPEAVRRYTVKDLPLLTAIDPKGKSIFY